MAVISVKLKRQESGVSDGVFTATRVYLVETDSLDDNSETARAACPSIGAYFDVTGRGRLISSRAQSFDDDLFTYEVTGEFSSKTDGSEVEDPLARPWKFSYGGSGVTEPF